MTALVAAFAGSGDLDTMSELLRLIDDYKDQHGQPSDASIARAIGVAPQTISSWRKRGIRDLPGDDALRELARLLRVDYEAVVLQVALYDVGRRDTLPPAAEADTA